MRLPFRKKWRIPVNRQPDIQDIRNAHERIRPHIKRTPVLTCSAINTMTGADVCFKCENFQKVGAFKFRGACNAIFSLSEEEASHGVITHSSGNHAAALSLAAGKRGIPARIVMPRTAPKVKIEAVRGYGGEITFCEPTLADREKTAAEIIERTGAVLIHSYNDYRIMAGQGTASLELIEEAGALDFILAPLGGGGLLSGTAITSKSLLPKIHVIGCEPENADDAYRSKKVGYIIPSVKPRTIADGLLTSLGDKTFPVIRDMVDEIVLVTEEEIVLGMKIIYERMKIVVEPSSAVTLAALLSRRLDVKNKKVGIILSGGNVDLDRFFKGLV
jgi:threonine dehydratase